MKQLAYLLTSVAILLVFTTCERLKSLEYIALEAKFKPTEPVVRVGTVVNFEQQSPPEVIEQYAWDFGDNTTSVERTPKHIYTQIGTYTIKLKVTKANNAVKETSSKIIVIPLTTTPISANTTIFSEKLPSGFPAPVDEVGVKTIFAPNAAFSRYFMVGRKNATGLYVIQTDENRNILWSQDIKVLINAKIVTTDILYDSVPNIRAALVIVGYAEYNENDRDNFIISLNPKNGEINWKYTNKSSNSDVYNSIDIIENNYVAFGNSTTRTTAGTDTKIKIDEFSINNGSLEFSTVLNASNSEVNDAKYVRLDNEGILACTETGIERPMLLRYTNKSQNPTKSYVGNSATNGKGLGLTKLTNGLYKDYYVLVGELHYGNKKDSTNAFIALFDKDRVFISMDVLAMYKESFFDVVEVGNALIVVGTHYNPLSQKDILMARYTIENNKPKRELLRLIGGDTDEEATRLVNDGINNISILGTIQSTNGGFLDMLFLKLNANTLQ